MGANIAKSPTAFEQLIQKVINGLTQVIPPKATLAINGAQMTQVQIIAKLQATLDELQAIRDARATLQEKLLAAKGDRPAEHEFLMQLHAALVAQLGRKNPQLAQFGFTPTKQPQTKVAVKTAAAAKRTVTRQMRHTMGKRQKQSVKAAATPDVTISNGTVSINTAPAAPATQAPQTTAPAAASGTQGAGEAAASGNASGASGNGSSKP